MELQAVSQHISLLCLAWQLLLALSLGVIYETAQAMVDVIRTRVHEVWEQPSVDNSMEKTKLTLAGLKRKGIQTQREKIKAVQFENNQLARDRFLFNVKEKPWMGFPKSISRPLMGSACGACSLDNKVSQSNLKSKQLSIKDVILPDTQNSENFLTRKFCHLVTNYQLKKYDYPQISDKVLKDEKLDEAIDDATQQEYDEKEPSEQNEELYKQIRTEQEARARRLLFNMRSTLSDFLLRLTSWLLYKLLPRFLTSVCLHPAQLEMLHKATKQKLPLVFIPLHRSHLDYTLISFILLNNNIRCPLVAAGENLKIPVFGWLLRGLGAFFIKRRIDPLSGKKDILYRAVLHSYIMQSLKAGHNMEFFIEGGRTRTGKPCMPKGGILSVIVDAYMDGTVDDVLLVPVSVNYEKLVDGNFVREQLGQPKEMESFGKAASAIWDVLNSNYGSMRIDFNQPFSLKELITSFQEVLQRSKSSDKLMNDEAESENDSNLNRIMRNGVKHFHNTPSSASLYGTDVGEDHRQLVNCIAKHITYDCAKACAVMSTNAVAFLLLNKYRDGVNMDTLVEALDLLRNDLVSSNKDIGFTGTSVNVIHQAVRLLGTDLVKYDCKNNTVTPVTRIPNVIELAYYNNGLVPHYVLQGVVATSICAALKVNEGVNFLDTSEALKINANQIISHCIELCYILQYEFIFTKPCQNLESVLSLTIEQFIEKEILKQKQEMLTEYEARSRRMARMFDEEDDYDDEDELYENNIDDSPEYEVNTDSQVMAEFEFYHTLLRSFIDVYTVTVQSLHRLVDRQVTETAFIKEVITDITSHLGSGYCLYGESCCVDPIRNALRLLEKWGVIEVFIQDRIRLVYLSQTFNDINSLENVYERIKWFKWTSLK